MEKYNTAWDNTLEAFNAALPGLMQDLGAAIKEGTDPLKSAMKVILNLVIDYVQGLIFAAEAAAAARASATFLTSLIADAPLLAAAYAGLEIARGFINSFAVGSFNVPSDQLAKVHQGEIIVPRTMSESIRRGDAALVGAGAGGPSSRYQMRRQTMVVNANIGHSAFESGYTRSSYIQSRRVM
jgi:hypothetical protein